MELPLSCFCLQTEQRECRPGNGGQMAIRKHEPAAKKRKVVRLSKEAFKTVDENAHTLAVALLKSAMEGKVMSARLLVELAEGDVDVEEGATVGPLRSLALRLARESQFQRPSPDVNSKTNTENHVPL